MTEKQTARPTAPENKRPAGRRRRFLVLKIALAALGLAVLAAAGALIWLRSSGGAEFAYRQAAAALEGAGLKLTAGTVEGPLPGRLFIRGAVLADKDGPLVKVALLEVRLKLLALLGGTAHVPLVRIDGPELIRLPVLPAGEDEAGGPLTLPVAVRLDRLDLTGGRVRAGALASLGLEIPELHLAAGGSARLEKSDSALNLTASVTEADGRELLQALVRLASGEGRPDRLELELKIDDRPGGLLSGLLADPGWPGLQLALQGRGPLNNWPGELSLAHGSAALTATLNFAGATGGLYRDLAAEPAWRAGLTAAMTPGSLLPPEALAWTGPRVALELNGGLTGARVEGEVSLAASGEPALELNARAAGELAPGGGRFEVKSALTGLLPPDSGGARPALDLAARVTAEAERLKVENLRLTGEGLALAGSLVRQAADGRLTAALDLDLADQSPWVREGLRLAGLDPELTGGAVKLTAEADWAGLELPLKADLKLAGRDLKWPTEQLAGLMGSNLTLQARASGEGAERPLKFEIVRAEAGAVSLRGEGSWLAGENPAFEARLEGGLADLAAVSPDLEGRVDFEFQGRGRLDDFSAELKAVSPELSAAPGVVTDLKIETAARGGLAGDQGPALTGRLDLTAADSPGGALALGTDWSFSQTENQILAAVSQLTGRLAGLALGGELTARLPAGEESQAPAGPQLEGSLNAAVSDWRPLAALTGQPLSGSPASLKIDLSVPDGRQAARAELSLPRLRLGPGDGETLALNQTSLAFRADDLFGRLDLDADLRLGGGLAGPLTWSAGRLEARGRAGAGDFSARLEKVKAASIGGGARDGLRLAGKYDLESGPAVDFNQLELRLGSSGLKLQKPLKLALGEALKIAPLEVAFSPAGRLAAEADLTAGAMKIKADLKGLPYAFFKPFAPEAAIPDGTLQSLAVNLGQGPGGLAGNFSLKTQAAPKELGNLKPVLALDGRLEGGAAPAVTVKGTIDGGPGWKANGRFNAKLGLTPGRDGGPPAAGPEAPLEAELDFSGPVSQLWGLLGQADRSVDGLAQIKARVSGPLSKLQPQGTVYLAGGRYEDSVLGLLVRDITVEAHSTPELPLRALVSAKDGQGGGLALEASVRDLEKPVLAAKGRLSRFNPLHRDDLSVFISGDLGAEGPLERPTLSSDLTIDRGEVDLKIALAGGSVPTLEISDEKEKAAPAVGGARLALKITVPNQFFIRGFGLESEWRGTLRVEGSTRRPSLVGSLAPVRGYFEAFSKEFAFSGGDISFNGGVNPILNLELTNQGPNITAIIRATGSAQNPQVSWESRPPLPREEVLSQVLFGKSASSISRFEALQLASAINDLTNIGKGGGGGFNALGMARESLGLDVLRLGGTEDDRERRTSSLSGSMGQEMSGASSRQGGGAQDDDLAVEAGKYLSDNIYVGVEHSAIGGAAVRFEVELSPRVSLEARTSAESSRVGLGYKRDY